MSDNKSNDPASRFRYVPATLADSVAQERASAATPKSAPVRAPAAAPSRTSNRILACCAVGGILVAALWLVRVTVPAPAATTLAEPAVATLGAQERRPDPSVRLVEVERVLAQVLIGPV